MHKLRLVILGATGSIGKQALDVCRMHADRIEVVGLAAWSGVDSIASSCHEFGCGHLAFGDERVKGSNSLGQLPEGVKVAFGPDAVVDLVKLDDVDMVLNAVSGEAGMRASYETLASGRVLALANKESLVVGGDLIMPLSTQETLLPVDSEHSAIYQCLLGESRSEMKKIWLTCSGGPFRGMDRDALSKVTPGQALAHPTWAMGPKITIDSATLMNKGLEVIEAMHLFDASVDDIRVVVHPQSCVHSMVELIDGSVKAHMGVADMRIPIQFALSFPHRWESPSDQIDFTKVHPLEFFDPDLDTFRCLALALEAGRIGGTSPCVMNAANEVAVAAFLKGECKLTDIDAVVESTMEHMGSCDVTSLSQLEEVDLEARRFAATAIGEVASAR